MSTPTLKYLRGNIGGKIGADNENEIEVKGEDNGAVVVSGNTATHTLLLQTKDATTAQKGVLPLATPSETNTGTNADKAITPSTLKTKLGTQTDKGIPYGDGSTNPVKWSRALTDGELMVGSTSGDPAPAKITSSDGSLSVVSGSNSIDLKAGRRVPTSIVTEQGTATPSSNSFNFFGDDLLDTTARGNTLNVTAKESIMAEARAGGTRVAPKNHVLKFWNGQYTFATGNAQGGAVTIDVKQTVASFLQPDSGGNAATSGRTLKIEGGKGCTTKRNSAGNGVIIDVTDSGGGMPVVFSEDQNTNMVAKKAYVSDYGGSSSSTLKLPTTAAKGDMISITAGNSSDVRVTQNSGDQITIGSNSTTRGTGGYIQFLDSGTSIILYLHSTTSTTKNWRVYSGFFSNIKVV